MATRSTGYEHVDVIECVRRGIAVSNVPSYGKHTVAEHVFGLLLTISHKLSSCGLDALDLRGKTLGVIGTGDSGRETSRTARGFDMDAHVVVSPHSAFKTREAVARLVDTTVENIEAFARGLPQNTIKFQ